MPSMKWQPEEISLSCFFLRPSLFYLPPQNPSTPSLCQQLDRNRNESICEKPQHVTWSLSLPHLCLQGRSYYIKKQLPSMPVVLIDSVWYICKISFSAHERLLPPSSPSFPSAQSTYRSNFPQDFCLQGDCLQEGSECWIRCCFSSTGREPGT